MLFLGCIYMFLLHTFREDREKMQGGWRTHFTNMQNKFDRPKIRMCSEGWGEFSLSGALLPFKTDRTVVWINVVCYKAMAAFDSWKENSFQLFSSSGQLSFGLLRSEIRPFLSSWHYPRLMRTARKSITVKPCRISCSAPKQLFNPASSRQTKQACRNSSDVCRQGAAASFLHSLAIAARCSSQQRCTNKWLKPSAVSPVGKLTDVALMGLFFHPHCCCTGHWTHTSTSEEKRARSKRSHTHAQWNEPKSPQNKAIQVTEKRGWPAHFSGILQTGSRTERCHIRVDSQFKCMMWDMWPYPNSRQNPGNQPPGVSRQAHTRRARQSRWRLVRAGC